MSIRSVPVPAWARVGRNRRRLESMEAQFLLDCSFEVTAVDPDGKKFDRVSRLVCVGVTENVDMVVDINSEVYPVRTSDKIKVVLCATLSTQTAAKIAVCTTKAGNRVCSTSMTTPCTAKYFILTTTVVTRRPSRCIFHMVDSMRIQGHQRLVRPSKRIKDCIA